MHSLTSMNLKQATQALGFLLDADIPTFLWGAPGIGKSEIVRQIANARGWTIIDFRCTTRDPVALMGLPSLDGDTTRWKVPDEFPQITRDGEAGILFLDELNAAAPSMQTAAFGLVLERKVGEYILPQGWRILAAGNRQSDRAAAQRMPSALANRFAHLDIEVHLPTLLDYFSSKGINPLLLAFLRFRSELIYQMDQNNPRAFPTPRAWERVAKIIDTPIDIRTRLVAALVGEAAAIELEGFLQACHALPTMEEIIANPATARIPDNPATQYAVAYALARHVKATSMAQAVTYLKRLSAEFLAMFMVDIGQHSPELALIKEYTQWAIEAQDMTLAA